MGDERTKENTMSETGDGNSLEEIKREVEDDAKFRRIVVTLDGERIHRYDPLKPTCIEDGPIPSVIIHSVCEGFTDVVRVARLVNAIRCRACGLRLLFPAQVKTWSELEEHFKQRMIAEKMDVL